MRRARLVLADEHRLVVEGLQRIVETEFEVIGSALDGRTLVDLACRLQPELVLTEIALPRLNGIEALIRIAKRYPRLRVMLVTRHADREHLSDALRAGASGYLLKDCSGSELLAAVREVLNGRSYITPLITADLFSTFREGFRTTGSPNLTERQREILQLIVEGQSLKEIASLLHISRKTVEYHKYGLMQSLGLRTNAQLIQYAFENRLVSLPAEAARRVRSAGEPGNLKS